MLSEIILGLVIVFILVLFALYVKETNKRINDLVKAVMSKSLQDYDASKNMENRQDTPEIDTMKEEMERIPEYIPAESADDEAWDRHLDDVIGDDR